MMQSSNQESSIKSNPEVAFGRGKTILYVMNDLTFFLSHRVQFAEAARSAGFRVVVAGPNEEQSSKIKELGFEFIPVLIDKWGMNPISEVRTILSLYALYTRLQPSLIHHSTIKPVLYGSVAARLAGIKGVINTISGMGYVFTAVGIKAKIRKYFIEMLYKFGLSQPTARLIVQNSDDQREFSQRGLIAKSQVVLIHGSGVDTEYYYPIPPPQDVTLVLMPSRLILDKGVGEFVDAARILHKKGISARFAIAGAAAYKNPAGVSEGQLNTWKHEGIVEFWGECSDMRDAFYKSHIVCLPSYREGLPRALIEAASCGRPIVTTVATGCREIVKDGYNGVLVEIRNSTALAEALERLISNKDLQYEMGSNSRKLIENGRYKLSDITDDTLNVYADVLSTI